MNELTHIDEFKKLLANYELSDNSRLTLSQTPLVLLVAPTSSGRNTVIREIMKTGDYYFIVSDTTRKPRTNDGIPEKDGVEYWFRNEQDVLADIREGNYLEAAIIHNQQVSGISVRELEKAMVAEKIAITDAEIAGVANVMKYKPDTHAIFVLPPSFEEWQRRIKHRGVMEAGEYKRRMESAAKEFSAALSNDYFSFVINDDVVEAATQVNHIAKLDEADAQQQADARALAQHLYEQTMLLLTKELQ